MAQRARGAIGGAAPAGAPSPGPRVIAPVTPTGGTDGAHLTALDRIDAIPAEYALLKEEITVGRGEDNDIVIPHASVSRNHARLIQRAGIFEVTDLNSTNGSYINNQTVQGSMRAANGSEIRFGDIRFTLRF